MFLTVLCAVFFGNTALVVAITVIAAVAIIIGMVSKGKHSYTMVTFGIGVVIASVMFLTAEYNHNLTLSKCGENRNVRAVVTSSADFSQENARFYVEARLKAVDSEKSYCKIRLSFSKSKDEIDPDSLNIGDEIIFNCYLYKIGQDSESVHNSFAASGVYTGAYSINNLRVYNPALRPVTYYTDLLKKAIIEKMNYSFENKTAGLLIGILTGDKDFCDDEVYKSFRISGAAHILAVSGLHMSIWISAFGSLFNIIKKRSKITNIIILVFVFLSVCVADFSPSVCRAALMSSLYLIGRMVGGEDDPLNSLGFAVACLLFVNVYVIYSVAFQLTFICMLSIIAVSVPVCKSFSKFLSERIKAPEQLKSIIYTVASSVIISVTVAVFTFPVCAWHFGSVSVLSPITNLLLIPVCAPLMILCLIYMILSFVPVVSDVVAFVIRALSEYMLKVTEEISSSSMASVSTGEYEITVWFIFMVCSGFIFLLYKSAHRSFARFISGLLAVFIIFTFFESAERKADEYRIRLIGNGDEVTAVIVYNGISVVAGVYDRYYFTQDAEFVIGKESSKTIAILTPDDTDKSFVEYVSADLGADYVIDKGEAVTLFERLTISNKGTYALVEGNGKRIAVVYKECLQPLENYDIIIKNDTVELNREGIIYSDENIRYGTVSVDGEGVVKIRGEWFWQSLTKKNLNLT